MNSSGFISPIFAVFGLLILATLFVLSYSNDFQRRLSSITELPPRRQRNILLAAAAMCFLLINPIMHAILIGAGIFLYRYFIKDEGVSITNTKRKAFFQTALVCVPKEERTEGEALAALRRCLFASHYVLPSSKSSILIEQGRYKVDVTLFSEKYLNSLLHFLGESGFNVVSNDHK